MCRRGDIYYVDFGDNHDSNKRRGIRPALAENVVNVDKSQLLGKRGEIWDPIQMEQITVALQIQIGAYAEYN